MTSRAKVAVLISGAGSNMAALLYASRVGAPYEIVLVASNDPHAGGLSLAEAEGIPTFALSHKGMKRAEHDAAMDEAIRKSGAEYVALAGYMRVLSDEMVARWEGRMLNIHPSLLPKYKGLDPHARALEAGDEAVGASVHLVTSELDGGEVLGQAEGMVMGGDTPELRQKFVATIPLGRMSTPRDVANAALYLASNEADFITGVCMEVDGGRCI